MTAGAGTIDPAEILVEGAWRHRFVVANGARFHVAVCGDGPLVVLLHGFPQFWWAWRHQLEPLAAAGYRAVAMDLRGYGGSDRPPRGYDPFTLTADVAGVVRSLGADDAVVVGQDLGGSIAWAMPALTPRVVRAVAVVAAAHPLTRRTPLRQTDRANRARFLGYQVPILSERSLAGGDGVGRYLRATAGPSGPFPDPEEVRRYTRAMRLPFVAHCALEYHRWVLRSIPRRDGRRFAADLRARNVAVPVLQVQGGADPWVRPESAARSGAHTAGPYRYHLLPGVGHFPAEEAPEAVTSALLEWLAGTAG